MDEEEEEEEEDDGDEEEDDDDENMSISDFSNDEDYSYLKVTNTQDPLTYFENRMLKGLKNIPTNLYHLPSDEPFQILQDKVSRVSSRLNVPIAPSSSGGTLVTIDKPGEDSVNALNKSGVSSQAPAEMKQRDKIPRTPIDQELLAQIHQDNVTI